MQYEIVMGRLSKKRSSYSELVTRVENPETRAEGLDALADSDVRNAAAIAAPFLTDRDQYVRCAALECLLERGNRRYTNHVCRALRDELDVNRVTALECLMQWRARASGQKILKCLDDESALVRGFAGRSLGVLRVRQAARPLLRSFEQEDEPDARAGMAEGLYRLTRSPQYLDVLLDMLRTEQSTAVNFVATSLLSIGDSASSPAIRETFQRRLKKESRVGITDTLKRCLSELPA